MVGFFQFYGLSCESHPLFCLSLFVEFLEGCFFMPVKKCQEKMLLQGVGMAEFHQYQMRSLTSSQLADLAGNSFLAFEFLPLLIGGR